MVDPLMQMNVEAVVLSARAVSEQDKRLVLFTRERGRLFARASGAFRPGAKLSAATEPGVRGQFRLWLADGAAGGRVTGGSVLDGHPALRGQWPRLTAALFLCEWMDRWTPLLHPAPEKFDLLVRALSALERHDVAVVRAAFLTQFARLAGYGPVPGVAETDLEDWDFDVPVTGANAPRVGEQVIQFLAPLLDRPLRTLAHGRALAAFSNKAKAMVFP
ncbi:MAG: recombination protein O N-terminal domain-containing protein [Elusimicrobia bacterium]|nr:recombination protein O N-terminal domain-containing protein [Elusimicrobiota bacterium]